MAAKGCPGGSESQEDPRPEEDRLGQMVAVGDQNRDRRDESGQRHREAEHPQASRKLVDDDVRPEQQRRRPEEQRGDRSQSSARGGYAIPPVRIGWVLYSDRLSIAEGPSRRRRRGGS